MTNYDTVRHAHSGGVFPAWAAQEVAAILGQMESGPLPCDELGSLSGMTISPEPWGLLDAGVCGGLPETARHRCSDVRMPLWSPRD